jgi:hypothetical protein
LYALSGENDLIPLAHGPYTRGMPKNTPPQKEARKIPKNFRLFAEDVRRLKLGAEKMGIPAAIEAVGHEFKDPPRSDRLSAQDAPDPVVADFGAESRYRLGPGWLAGHRDWRPALGAGLRFIESRWSCCSCRYSSCDSPSILSSALGR